MREIIADVSIVIISIGRKSLTRAVMSIFSQKYDGNIQILIGLDGDFYGNAESIKEFIIKACPGNMYITWIDVGYSTSKRHGGVHHCFFGGSLRTSLSFLAQSKYVMYLDDDDWLSENHCTEIMAVIEDNFWAFALCFYADGNLEKEICEDLLESVGINRGLYKDDFGGFVRPSGLLINKLKLASILHLWADALSPSGDGEDRLMFNQLRNLAHGFTGRASVYYAIDPKDSMHAKRIEFINKQGKCFESQIKNESAR
jgi:glycosyltransferase involved in cell wall biosynthesis